MPLCTILTKCPAPAGPQCRYPCSAEPRATGRDGVRGIAPEPGASAAKIGSRRCTGAALAADHQAVAALQAMDAAAGADVHVVEPPPGQRRGAADVVVVVRVAAVDDDVARGEQRRQRVHLGIDQRRRHHQPHRARRPQRVDEAGQRRRPGGAFGRQCGDRLRRDVEHDALVAGAQQPPHHVPAHASQPDHPQLHRTSRRRRARRGAGAFRRDARLSRSYARARRRAAADSHRARRLRRPHYNGAVAYGGGSMRRSFAVTIAAAAALAVASRPRLNRFRPRRRPDRSPSRPGRR